MLSVSANDIGRTESISTGAAARIGAIKAGPSATSALSLAFLRAAAEGLGYEALHTAIMALLENRPFARDLGALARIGHTSGWDAIAGAALVLRSVSSASHKVSAPA